MIAITQVGRDIVSVWRTPETFAFDLLRSGRSAIAWLVLALMFFAVGLLDTTITHYSGESHAFDRLLEVVPTTLQEDITHFGAGAAVLIFAGFLQGFLMLLASRRFGGKPAGEGALLAAYNWFALGILGSVASVFLRTLATFLMRGSDKAVAAVSLATTIVVFGVSIYQMAQSSKWLLGLQATGHAAWITLLASLVALLVTIALALGIVLAFDHFGIDLLSRGSTVQ